ncbi:MAG: hypothetical protein ACE15F_17275 [bacterium]
MQKSFRVMGILACLMLLAGSGAMAQVGIFPKAVNLDTASNTHAVTAGSATESNGVYTMKGNGADVWGKGDEAYFVYTELAGPQTISAKVKWIDAKGDAAGGSDWAKVGVMIREKGDVPESKHYWIELRCGAGNPALGDRIDPQWRPTEGADSLNIEFKVGGNFVGTPAGIWLRATRLPNNVFVSEYSNDGKTWYFVHTIKTITMQDTVAYGLCITSHTSDTALVTAEVSDVYLGAPVGIASSAENWEIFK